MDGLLHNSDIQHAGGKRRGNGKEGIVSLSVESGVCWCGLCLV